MFPQKCKRLPHGYDLLTFSNFKLWDPELNSSNGTAYPNVSSYSVGVKFSF